MRRCYGISYAFAVLFQNPLGYTLDYGADALLNKFRHNAVRLDYGSRDIHQGRGMIGYLSSHGILLTLEGSRYR